MDTLQAILLGICLLYTSYRNDAVLDMLNTRYLIVPGDDGQPQAVRRATANGPAWFVDEMCIRDSSRPVRMMTAVPQSELNEPPA